MGYCTIADIISNPDGTLAENVWVSYAVTNTSAGFNDTVLTTTAGLFTDAHGEFEIEVPQGSTIRLKIPQIGLDAYAKVPELETANLQDLSYY